MAVWYSVWKHWKGCRSERRKKVCICDHHWFIQEWEPFWKRVVSTSITGSIAKWVGHQTWNSEVTVGFRFTVRVVPFWRLGGDVLGQVPSSTPQPNWLAFCQLRFLTILWSFTLFVSSGPEKPHSGSVHYFIYLPLCNGNHCIERLVMNELCMIGKVTAKDRMLSLTATCFATGLIYHSNSGRENVLRHVHFTLFNTLEYIHCFKRH